MPGAKILCVDRTNDGRGLFVQAYLELLRIWLANATTSRSWLFKDISSAGLRIVSPFSTKHAHHFPKNSLVQSNQSRSNWALHAFAADKKSFEGVEKDIVVARIANRQIRGLRVEDFKGKDYILCFDKDIYQLLKVLKAMASADAHGAEMPVKIHYIHIGYELHKHQHELMAAKKELRSWATTNLGWRAPTLRHDMGIWNTKQIIIPEPGYIGLLRDNERRLDRIKTITGCDFHFSTGKSGNTRIVSITGRKDKLELAAIKASNNIQALKNSNHIYISSEGGG